MTTGNASQYADSAKLAARARLNREYTIAEIPWFPWVAHRLPIREGDRILDIGCGPGWFWAKVAADLPERFTLTLAEVINRDGARRVDDERDKDSLRGRPDVESRQSDDPAQD